jgi:hypothetical protein
MDDWNWDSGALYRIIDEEKLFVSHQKEIFTKGEDMEDFWNGIGIFLIEK